MAKQKQLYWDDVEIGNEVTPLSKIATTQMLVKWAGASGDFNPLHYDYAVTTAWAFGKPIVHGQLKRAWLVQMITDWIGEPNGLRRFSCRLKATDYPRLMKDLSQSQAGETWWCKGKVTKKYIRDYEHYVECDIWIENGKGEHTAVGNATVTLPLQR